MCVRSSARTTTAGEALLERTYTHTQIDYIQRAWRRAASVRTAAAASAAEAAPLPYIEEVHHCAAAKCARAYNNNVKNTLGDQIIKSNERRPQQNVRAFIRQSNADGRGDVFFAAAFCARAHASDQRDAFTSASSPRLGPSSPSVCFVDRMARMGHSVYVRV